MLESLKLKVLAEFRHRGPNYTPSMRLIMAVVQLSSVAPVVSESQWELKLVTGTGPIYLLKYLSISFSAPQQLYDTCAAVKPSPHQ